MPTYKVLVGQHIDNHPSHAGDHVYAEGDLVETEKDLCRFNARGMDPKFERLHEDGRLTREEWETLQMQKKQAAPTPATEQPVRAPVTEQPVPQPPKEAAPQQPFTHGQQRQQGKGR